MIKFLLFITVLAATITAAWNTWGETPTYLYVDTAKYWLNGRIYANNNLVGFGTVPAFSYGKDRIAYLDSAWNIIVTDGFKQDTMLKMPFRQYRATVSWDSIGHLYYAQELSVIRLDTASKTIDTVFTFKDSSRIKSQSTVGVHYTWQLCEGNVVDGKAAAFTLNRGDNNNNSIWFCDFTQDTSVPMLYTSGACQAALSYDTRYVSGTFYGHVFLDLFPLTAGQDSIIFDGESVWVIRFFKFAPNYISWFRENYGSKLVDFILGREVWSGDRGQLFDYIPDDPVKAETAGISRRWGSAPSFAVDIRGRKVSGNPGAPGVYFRRGARPGIVVVR